MIRFIFSSIIFISFGLFCCVNGEDAPVIRYAVHDGPNVTCILAEFGGQIDAKLSVNETIIYIINGTVNTNQSSCGTHQQELVIDNNDGNTLGLIFDRTNSSIMLSKIQFTVNGVEYQSNDTKTLYTVPEGNSFKCDAGISTDLTNENVTISLSLKSVRINAFRKQGHDDFEANSICSADAKSNKTVPMIIAFVLAGMVVVMLVGYIILRRREDKSVYETV